MDLWEMFLHYTTELDLSVMRYMPSFINIFIRLKIKKEDIKILRQDEGHQNPFYFSKYRKWANEEDREIK